jgi:hypothetical protein
MGTLSTLSNVQIDRAAAFPKRFADNPFRALALSEIQHRNAALDALFYDVGIVGADETPHLASWLAREGAIIVVPPSDRGKLRVFPTLREFFQDGASAVALAVAGVGSSALGAAAFARNVADAIGEPVAAVVSGYGLADVLTEALGGFFWFGGLNSLRHMFEPLDAVSKRFSESERSLELSEGVLWTRTSKDTETVVALLKDERFTPKFLVGHSKGNLVISEALYAIATESKDQAKALAKRARIVTISAKIGMPPIFHDVIDVIGEWDWFGALNSRPDLPADYVVPRAWHSTNPDFPMGMGIDVTTTLRKVLAMRPSTQRVRSLKDASEIFDMPQRMTAAMRGSTSQAARTL